MTRAGRSTRLSPRFGATCPLPCRSAPPRTVATALDRSELIAARRLVAAVLTEIPADLVEAALFGSKARGSARSDSDVDLLLIFRRLPAGREPHAGRAEAIAAAIASDSGTPITVWSVSLDDLRPGRRTPMLVDALADALPIWTRGEPVRPVPFTPADAIHCALALLERVAEGSDEFARSLERGRESAAVRRARDDLVRLCTARLLLSGLTRPRRGEVIDAFVASRRRERSDALGSRSVLGWARRSFGGDGREEDLPVAPPPGGVGALAASIDHLRSDVLAIVHARTMRSRQTCLDATRGRPDATRSAGLTGHWNCTPPPPNRLNHHTSMRPVS